MSMSLLDPPVLPVSFSQHRHPYLCILLTSRFSPGDPRGLQPTQTCVFRVFLFITTKDFVVYCTSILIEGEVIEIDTESQSLSWWIQCESRCLVNVFTRTPPDNRKHISQSCRYHGWEPCYQDYIVPRTCTQLTGHFCILFLYGFVNKSIKVKVRRIYFLV